MKKLKVLVTGGAGYVGSTVCSALIDKGYTPIILDSLITGKIEFTHNKIFYKGDIADKELLKEILSDHPDIKFVVHCAALIIVTDSMENPYEYYKENVVKSLELFKNLNELGCKNIIFSSSASVYDDTEEFTVTERSNLHPRSTYARTKYMMEMILRDFCDAYDMKAIVLRYFNIIGADPKMRSGVHVQSPTHVLGKLVDVALGKEPIFKITGVNYNTRDGSSIRDYIHVWDLAMAHIKAIENFYDAFKKADIDEKKFLLINLGTGTGVTVKELVSAFEKVYGKTINKTETDPRIGDVVGAYTNSDKALKILGWKVEKTLEEGIEHALKWGEIREKIISY